jgi:alpha-galactosidase
MQRKHFIKISTLSLAGLLITNFTKAGGKKTPVMQMPDKVEILFDDTYFPLQSSDQQTWKYKEAIVELKKGGDKIEVYVQSPVMKLKEVRLSWKHATAGASSILGDAYERTYGDISWKKINDDPKNLASKKLPWYCVAHDDHNTLCFGVKTGCNSICYWQISKDTLQVTLDTRNGGNGVQLNSRKLHAADIVTTKNDGNENAFATVRRFCTIMCDNPRLPEKPVYGINDWYFAYGNNSAALILETTSLMAALASDSGNPPFSVIDAGWALKSPALPDDCCWGDDFSVPNSKFGDMKKLAGEIKKMGMRPGLWTRPLSAKHDDKKSLLLASIPGRDDPKNPVLDPTISENIERIKYLWNTYRQWDFEMVKHDFSTYDLFGKWGFQMQDEMTKPGWQFNDSTKTNAEIILHLYNAIREAAGIMYLIGCNTVSHLSAGIFELNRIGDDTSGKEWSRTRKMGVNTLGFRMVQHETFYEADGDCVGLTKDIPWNKNKQWMELLAKSSAPLFISAQPDAIGEEQKKFIKQSFSEAANPQPIGEPLDWLTNPFPSKWRLDGQVVNFDWS